MKMPPFSAAAFIRPPNFPALRTQWRRAAAFSLKSENRAFRQKPFFAVSDLVASVKKPRRSERGLCRMLLCCTQRFFAPSFIA
ncbi:hypothetical protein [Ottowia sp. oral taxon 894]|uniref:hypothetical protein n=1 Tax=Ottowia sp. oral taxon 894 TaxID=1658672 RepID=UPI0012E2700F|nr:hypothetical protein [Ottowia sp. oral taxon 894]